MTESADFFEQDFFVDEHKKVSATVDEYSIQVVLDRDVVNFDSAELTITSLLKKELEKNQWRIVDQQQAFGGSYSGNQITAVKNSKTLIILLGDGMDKSVKSPPNYLVTDSVYDFAPDVEFIHINPEIYGLHKFTAKSVPVCRPTKLFNCFISVADSYRQCWFYNFVRRGYLSQANISFLLNQYGIRFSDQPSEQKTKFYNENKNVTINDIFDSEHELMQSQVPYKNFTESLEQATVDSKCSLVLETSYASPGQVYFTEKTFRALQLPRPCIVVSRQGVPGRMAYLRQIGFDVYDDVIDHNSYDNMDDPIAQMTAVLEQIERLREFEFTSKVLQEFEQRAQHNRNLIEKFNRDLVTKYQTVVDKIKQIS